MLIYEGRLSLYCFLGTSSLILLLSIPQIFFEVVPNFSEALYWGPIFYYILINLIIRFGLKGYEYQIAVRGSFLGFIFSGSILVILNASKAWKPFGIYGVVLSFFHYSEFLAIAFSNPKSLSIKSFILNDSIHYAVAAILSWAEFIVECYFYPGLKRIVFFWIVGLTMCLVGETLRKLAMVTASSSFAHLVQFTKAEDHRLIMHGVYSLMRHPSYAGWFLWSIGTQIILCNPLCVILYALASWKFFEDRIYLEEITLLNFFGDDYYEYQQKVPTGLPFIKGFRVNLDRMEMQT